MECGAEVRRFLAFQVVMTGANFGEFELVLRRVCAEISMIVSKNTSSAMPHKVRDLPAYEFAVVGFVYRCNDGLYRSRCRSVTTEDLMPPSTALQMSEAPQRTHLASP